MLPILPAPITAFRRVRNAGFFVAVGLGSGFGVSSLLLGLRTSYLFLLEKHVSVIEAPAYTKTKLSKPDCFWLLFAGPSHARRTDIIRAIGYGV